MPKVKKSWFACKSCSRRSSSLDSAVNHAAEKIQSILRLALSSIMPALDSLAIATQKQVLERRNWANENRGPVLVFVIVFIVGMGIALLLLYRQWMKRKAARQAYE
ncbi:uncharacterized protein BDV14DRAFT_171711 [Aspergillus stella-maris]|uniref:uncharacterized protein n=1 Tax=Aspergillus stella-maris TaxID=1810926 RepID=UPI003CCD7886